MASWLERRSSSSYSDLPISITHRDGRRRGVRLARDEFVQTQIVRERSRTIAPAVLPGSRCGLVKQRHRRDRSTLGATKPASNV